MLMSAMGGKGDIRLVRRVVASTDCLVAEFEDDLVRCLPPTSKPRGLWLLTTQRLRKTPRISVVFDFLSDRLKRLSSEQEARLAGPASEAGV